MYTLPGPSWQVGVRDPFDLFFVLYVGESLGLLSDELPLRLSAPVPRSGTEVPASRLNVLRDQWSDWWAAALADRSRQSFTEDGSGDVGAGVGPELGEARQALLSSAHRWRAVNEWRMDDSATSVPNDVVRQIELGSGRRARPFSYSVDVLPVTGPYVHDLSKNHALLSERQCSDPTALAAILRPRLEELA